MTQSRRASLLESAANIAVGYGVAVAAQTVIFPLFGIDVPISDNLQIGGFINGWCAAVEKLEFQEASRIYRQAV